MKINNLLIFIGIFIFCIFFSPCVRSETDSKGLNKIITPNNDNKNDTFIFRCYNPQDAQVTGKIYDLKGKEVSKMTDISTIIHYPSSYLEWNPNSENKRAPTGIYIYQIVIQDRVYTGTVLVIR